MLMYRLSRLTDDIKTIKIDRTTAKSVFYSVKEYGELRIKRESLFSYRKCKWFYSFEQAQLAGLADIKGHLQFCKEYGLNLTRARDRKLHKMYNNLLVKKEGKVITF